MKIIPMLFKIYVDQSEDSRNKESSKEKESEKARIRAEEEERKRKEEEEAKAKVSKGSDTSKWSLTTKIGIGTAATGLTIAAGGLAVIGFGFGSLGIIAGSAAAATQSALGSVAAGSWFATMTSMGMTGVFSTAAVAGGATAGVGATTIVLDKVISSQNENSNKKMNIKSNLSLAEKVNI